MVRPSKLARFVLNASGEVHRRFPRSSIVNRLHSAVRKAYDWYEGGWPIWTGGNYSYLPSLVQDARWDQNYVTRREMMRRMRYFSQNSALVEAILSVGERYTVGADGLHVSFYPNGDLSADSDDSWYERADQVVKEWFENCGWNSESMERMLKIGYRCQRVDGEVFNLKTRKLVYREIYGRKVAIFQPTLQMIEAHRVETPWTQFDQWQEYNVIDGVKFKNINVGNNSESRILMDKVGYYVRNGMGSFEQNDSWNLIDKENIWHIYNSHRVNQYRGLSDFYSCAMDLHKLEDLIEIELKAQASQSIRAVAVVNNAGLATSPADPKLRAVSNYFNQGNPANCNGQAVAAPDPRWETFRKETGAYVYGLKTGEEVKFDAPNRPSDATLNLWEGLTNRVCAATHMPRALVLEKISSESARAQGTELRAQLDSADNFFKSDFVKWRNFVREAVIWFMEWAIYNDSRVADPPSDWRTCIHIQQPEACNVDAGYTTQADLSLLAAGALSYAELLGRRGLSVVTTFKQLSREQKLAKKLGLKLTLPALIQGGVNVDEDEEQDETPPKKKELANK